MTDYEYDPDLPYVVEAVGRMLARFVSLGHAEDLSERYVTGRIIDTTPKPRVPDDAKFITYLDGDGYRWYAARDGAGWMTDGGSSRDRLEDLPDVTPETKFTVLDERKTDD